MVKILICDPIHEEGMKLLEKAGFDVDEKPDISHEELGNIIGEYDGIIVRSATKVTRDILENPGKLKAIARAGVGLDNIDLDKAKEKDIKIFNSPEAPCNAVAELVLGFIITLARNITQADSSMKEGKWEKRKLTGIEITGKKLGIIGFGRIGYNLGSKAKSLGMEVLAFDVAMDKLRHFVEEIGAKEVDLETLIANSDFISIHVPLLPQTKHMISSKEFDSMKDGVYIINAARGGVIDEKALKEALRSGKVAGAGLDVFESEPDPDPELVKNPNLVATPHIGAGTEEAQIANSTIVADKLIDFLK
jgi:D-3-phosphoglycerate dehydrogenase